MAQIISTKLFMARISLLQSSPVRNFHGSLMKKQIKAALGDLGAKFIMDVFGKNDEKIPNFPSKQQIPKKI
jgi:hypothetical protein